MYGIFTCTIFSVSLYVTRFPLHLSFFTSRVPFVVYDAGNTMWLKVYLGGRERKKALNVHESECLSAKERVALA